METEVTYFIFLHRAFSSMRLHSLANANHGCNVAYYIYVSYASVHSQNNTQGCHCIQLHTLPALFMGYFPLTFAWKPFPRATAHMIQVYLQRPVTGDTILAPACSSASPDAPLATHMLAHHSLGACCFGHMRPRVFALRMRHAGGRTRGY